MVRNLVIYSLYTISFCVALFFLLTYSLHGILPCITEINAYLDQHAMIWATALAILLIMPIVIVAVIYRPRERKVVDK